MIYAVFYYGNSFGIFQFKRFNFNLFIKLQKEVGVNITNFKILFKNNRKQV